MKKKICILLVAVLLIGVNVYAAGDLVVTGNIGAGTSTPGKKLDVVGQASIAETFSSGAGGQKRALQVSNAAEGTFAGASVIGIDGAVSLAPSTATHGIGFQMQAQHESDQNTPSLKGGYFLVQYRSDANTTITESSALHILHSKSVISLGQTTVSDGYGILSEVRDEASTGTLNFGSFKHINLLNPDTAISATDLTGLWIDKQTEGTNNYGIVLNGTGGIGDYGAAIAFGTNQSVQLYAKGDGKLWVSDGVNETQHSPHDPVTNEWIFYSKNIKTGKVVRVNMEKLVRAVENLTGEKFMIETFEETK